MKIVFDFAGVVFHWKPIALVRATLPPHAADQAGARAPEGPLAAAGRALPAGGAAAPALDPRPAPRVPALQGQGGGPADTLAEFAAQREAGR